MRQEATGPSTSICRRNWEPAGRFGPNVPAVLDIRSSSRRSSSAGRCAQSLSYETGGVTAAPSPRKAGMFASREQPVAPATGALGAVPHDAYHVTKRYGDGRPWAFPSTATLRVKAFHFQRRRRRGSRGRARSSAECYRHHARSDRFSSQQGRRCTSTMAVRTGECHPRHWVQIRRSKDCPARAERTSSSTSISGSLTFQRRRLPLTMKLRESRIRQARGSSLTARDT